MILLCAFSTALSMPADYSPCELKYHSTNPTISYAVNDWCAIGDKANRIDALATPFNLAKAVELLANTTTCQLFPKSERARPSAETEFVTNLCAAQRKYPHDTRFRGIASKCLPPTIAPQHLQTCTDLLAEARLHWCSCGMGGDGCTKYSQTTPQYFKRNCPIGMQDKDFWRRTYLACKTVVDDWTARKSLYNNTQSPLEMLGLMTDCADQFCADQPSLKFNYTEAYYTAENSRAYSHAAALRSLKLQCLLAPTYNTKYDNAALPMLIVQWNRQWCRDLF